MLVFLLNLSKKTMNFAYFLSSAKREDKSLSSGEGFRVKFFKLRAHVYSVRNDKTTPIARIYIGSLRDPSSYVNTDTSLREAIDIRPLRGQ
jgi:hypothetical protein